MATAFLTIPEVARLLRVGQRTAYSLARSGELVGAVRVGVQWRVSRAALQRWADAGARHGRRRKGSPPPHGRRAS